MNNGMDPSLLQDFLTEASELIEQLDADLVTLEGVAGTPDAQGLLDSVFRALHTIKGAASFLGLSNTITFAHAAEDALNRLRKGEVDVDAEVMDAMLRSADVIREMIDELNAGEEASEGPSDLIDVLHKIAGQANSAAAAAEPVAEATPSVEAVVPETEGAGVAGADEDTSGVATAKPLELHKDKADLIEFMVIDLREGLGQIDAALMEAKEASSRTEAVATLVEVSDGLVKTADFFDLQDLTQLVRTLAAAAPQVDTVSDDVLVELLIRLRAISHLVTLQADALDRNLELCWPLETFFDRLTLLAESKPLGVELTGAHGGDVQKVLELDGVLAPSCLDESEETADAAPAAAEAAPDESQAPVATDAVAAPADAVTAEAPKDAADKATPEKAAAPKRAAGQPVAEATIRVEVGRLEELLNLVGQLVLTKNRMLALGRKLRDHDVPTEFFEDVAGASGDLDRLTGELQVGVMRTRMQPLAKLFDRYPRVIRDVARATEKQIDLEIIGKDTEVDKSVLELLADPLVHILRNSADHGVELPEVRKAAGKPAKGTITLQAEHQGSHVRLAIVDDGKGIDREVIGAKAIEKGLTTPGELAAMADTDVFRFIFAAGFSTAEKVTDLSGRGVGMDVVRTNITKMNGEILVNAVKGQGTTIEILIPLTVAIMPAMMVGIGKHLYAVPLQSVVEIVKPSDCGVHTIHGQPVMRLRDSVLPLLNMRNRLAETNSEHPSEFAVVVAVGGMRAGLMVDTLVGQQEIVIKPLDDEYTQGGPFSGATIREDGDVSLILDVNQLVRQAQVGERAAA